MIRAIIALLTVLTLQGSAAAQAQRRAIVIGIGEYRELQGIVRPVGDARAVHDRLSQLGFTAGLWLTRTGQPSRTRSTASPLRSRRAAGNAWAIKNSPYFPGETIASAVLCRKLECEPQIPHIPRLKQ